MQLDTSTLTPMLSQYWEIKKRYLDAILFYRMGDFYEMFFDDALTAAPILEVQLTSRDKSSGKPVPMCGVPHHSATGYLQKLLRKGKKIALCEQMEDPSAAKGLVKRDVIRVITPALISDLDLASENENYWLLSVGMSEDGTFPFLLVDFLDAKWQKGTFENLHRLSEFLHTYRPKEILTHTRLSDSSDFRKVCEPFPLMALTLRDSYFAFSTETLDIRTAAERYLEETQKTKDFSHFRLVDQLENKNCLRLNPTAIHALNVVGYLNSRTDEGVTLFHVLDHCETAMGRRLLREWLLRPLIDREKIQARLDTVEELLSEPRLLTGLQESLRSVRDMERLTTKLAVQLAMPRELVAIREVLKRIPKLQALAGWAKSPLLLDRLSALEALPELTQELERGLLEEPPLTYREGNVFREDYHPDLTVLRALSSDAKTTIANLETRERERTGISSLKLKYSRVFGFTIEVTKSHLSKIPSDYIRKQTIANGERYITRELKEFEEKWSQSEEKMKRLEERLFLELRERLRSHSQSLLKTAKALAELDVLMSLAVASRKNGYRKPEITDQWDLFIENGRHPIVETLLPKGEFVPNSIDFSHDSCRTILITGPNMSGKSTIMRQVALTILLAQMGCFVPADKAVLPVTDAIYTRVGSSDDISTGRSTFLVEMTEMADILNSATAQSLIVIDEVGRGTSTYDGLSLAWSLVEHLHGKTQAKLLFSTHFHELTLLEKRLPAIRNMNVLVEHWEGNVVFLHRLVPGVCWRSYGVDVAKLAGIPDGILDRAREILGQLESQSRKIEKNKHLVSGSENQLGFFSEPTT